jgi:hypothetical protein
MRIPYVIDNQQHRLADVLNEVLAAHAVTEPESAYGGKVQVALRREDLHLICFDFLSGG